LFIGSMVVSQGVLLRSAKTGLWTYGQLNIYA
jgi:hypothetical protein